MSLTLTIIFSSAILVNIVFNEDLIDLCLELIGWLVDTAQNVGFEFMLWDHRERVYEGSNPKIWESCVRCRLI